MRKGNYYITTAIAYTSAKPHVGNVYETVLADSIARYKRLEGYDVRFQTGTDEHGQKIELKAKEAGITPKEYVDRVSDEIKEIYRVMNISYDHFIRTTDAYHEQETQKIFDRLYANGDIYKGKYVGWYCINDEAFYTESQVVDGKCPDCGRELTRSEEECYFLKLSKYQKQLEEHIETHPEFIQPESRRNEMLNNFIRPGLQDLAVSRTTVSWGIPVDFDPKHVIYVWLDALSNYITGLGYDVEDSSALFDQYWPADVHLIGKDILRFHTIYWPIMLMALDLPLPKQVFGHPWLLVGDGKMSKSRGNAIYAEDLVKVLGVDGLRYIMLHEMPFERDGNITFEQMVERVNTDLANILGNLVNRTISMSNKYFKGTIHNKQVSGTYDDELIGAVSGLSKRVAAKMNSLRVADAIDEIIDVLRRCNKYIDETTPWVLGKDPLLADRLETVLYNLLEGIRVSAIHLLPFIPDTAALILKQLKTEQVDLETTFGFAGLESPITITDKPEIIFARLDVEETVAKMSAPAATAKVIEHKAEITMEDFAKVELRVGTVLSCKLHPKADRLLVSQIDIGDKVVQIVSGVRPHYEPEDMVGRRVIVVANLKEAVLRSEKSQGMLLCAENDDDSIVEVLTSLKTDLPNGSTVR